MAEITQGPGFPMSSVGAGHLHFNTQDNVLYRYNGSGPSKDSANWVATITTPLPTTLGGIGVNLTDQYQLCSFILSIQNVAGTLKHNFSFPGGGVRQKLNAFPTSQINTPLVNSSTPFPSGSGFGILSTAQSFCYLDLSNSQSISEVIFFTNVINNGTGADVFVATAVTNTNIGGVTQGRPLFVFRTTSSVDFNINTTNIPASAFLVVQTFAFFK